ncbi:MAG TPA: tetratricopeptide repeat protein, partial [bacterium]
VVLPFLIRAPHDPENNFINKAFLPPAILWFSPLVLRGAEWIYEQTSRAKRLLLIGAMLLLAANLAFSYTQNNASQNTAIENVGCDILQQMPSHSVLYSEGDSVTFPLAYFKLVLNLRPDVEVFDRTGGLFKDLYHLLDYRKNPEVSPDKLVAIERSYEREHLPTAVFYSESAESPSRALTMTGLLFQAIDKTALVFPDDQLWNHFRTPKVRISNDYLSRETAARFYLFKTTYDLDFSKNTSLALEDIRQAKTLAFDNSRLLVNAGVVENAHDLTDQAGLTFERATDVNPDFYLAWYDRGVTSDKQHQNKDAIRYLQKAIQLAPDSLEGHQRLAFQYYQAKRYSDAVKEWETARKLNPLSPDNYRNLGFIFMQSQPEYAAQLFCQYLALAPQSPDRPVIEKFLSNVGP